MEKLRNIIIIIIIIELLSQDPSNVLFFIEAGEPTAQVTVGPFVISIEMIKVGITASLIVIPAHLLVVLLFKNAGPKKQKPVEGMEENDLNASQVEWIEQSGKPI